MPEVFATDRDQLSEYAKTLTWGHVAPKHDWVKRTLWEESTRVPMIIAGPGLLADHPISKPVGLIDIYPTLVDLCSLPPKKGLDGVSLGPLLTTPDAAWERPAITTFSPNNHSIRSEHWRYIRYDDGSEELYDHRKDQRERHNLADNPEHRSLMQELSQWIPKDHASIPQGSIGSGTPL